MKTKRISLVARLLSGCCDRGEAFRGIGAEDSRARAYRRAERPRLIGARARQKPKRPRDFGRLPARRGAFGEPARRRAATPAVTPRQREEIGARAVCTAGARPLPCASLFRGLAGFSPRVRHGPLPGQPPGIARNAMLAMEGTWPRADSGALQRRRTTRHPSSRGCANASTPSIAASWSSSTSAPASCSRSVGSRPRPAARSTRPRASARSSSSCCARNPGPFPTEGIAPVFREIISATRSLERVLRVGYFGPEGTFTHLAARRQFGQLAELASLGSIAEVFAAVERRQIDLGVVPVENTTEGVVTQTFDCARRARRLDLRGSGAAHLAAAAVAQRPARGRTPRGVASAAARAVPALARPPSARQSSGSRRRAPPSRRGSRPRTAVSPRSEARSPARSTVCARSRRRSRIAATTPRASS